jgi:hypothetical protein
MTLFSVNAQLLHLLIRQLIFRKCATSVIFETLCDLRPFSEPFSVGVSYVRGYIPLQLAHTEAIHLAFQEVGLFTSHP